MTVPESPIATMRRGSPIIDTAFRREKVPENLAVQASPSGEVKIVPESPTATKPLAVPVSTPFRLAAAPVLTLIQSTALVEVTTVPPEPTAT
jgi:hypothetical protein